MGPHLDPAQRLFAAWLAHHLRRQLQLVVARLEAASADPLSPEQHQHLTVSRSVLTRALAGLDELAASP